MAEDEEAAYQEPCEVAGTSKATWRTAGPATWNGTTGNAAAWKAAAGDSAAWNTTAGGSATPAWCTSTTTQTQTLMLLNDFYTIGKWAVSDTTAGEVRATLLLNAAHPIFAAHFPGQPVVSGACQLQMVEELLSHVLGHDFRLVSAGQIKFLTPIDPRIHRRIEAVLQYALDGPFRVTAIFRAADTTFLKLNGIFGAE